ncbi:plasmid partitioning protein RepB C-terminal domain-containing protein [Granulicella tundricola]|uniref:RepB plasmid partition n=1 Tax=Granulicella tundricola (strain ATCC BAA-1859 / DSM 23138 / MP5ACTX9) TaxID=1198114 RepID=E8X2E4_GRATM|nr:plasmid partitioning protein RepB C-terminal domain-containing protein [Granulicella tundricola]ADW68076.1 RepB plasmid partition [Granulicella tundricola MP5ACTX9]
MAAESVKIAFIQEVLEVPLESLKALKETTAIVMGCRKYKQIKASLEHIGMIEPLAVFPQKDGSYLVLNGNLRLHILRELGHTSARCIVALDDESYTYNKRVNAMSPIAEHYMILKAIANGVTEERLAVGLSIDIEAIRRRRNLLDGICPEAVDMLKDKRISHDTFSSLRKMKPLRQIEAAELMISASNYTSPFAAVILSVTKPELLEKPPKKSTRADPPHASSLLEETTDSLISDLAHVRKTYGIDVLSLTVICRCIESLIENRAVVRYLQLNHTDIFEELKRLVDQSNADRAHLAPHETSDEAA